MAKKKKYKHSFTTSCGSDDLATMDGAVMPNGEDADESQVPGAWFEFKWDGEILGDCRMAYGNYGWGFEFRSNTHRLSAGAFVEDEDGETPKQWLKRIEEEW